MTNDEMIMLDELAKLAMVALIAKSPFEKNNKGENNFDLRQTYEQIANGSYAYASAMLTARSNRIRIENLNNVVKVAPIVPEPVENKFIGIVRNRKIYEDTVVLYCVNGDFKNGIELIPRENHSIGANISSSVNGTWDFCLMEKPVLWLHDLPVYNDTVLITQDDLGSNYEIVASEIDPDADFTFTPIELLLEYYEMVKNCYKVK